MFKKIIVLLLLSLAVCGFADKVNPEFYRVRQIQVFLINTEEFPDYEFYAFPSIMDCFFGDRYKVTSKTRLVSRHPESRLRIVAIRKDLTDRDKKLLQSTRDPLTLDFCNITPYNYGLDCHHSMLKEKAQSARVEYKIAKIENNVVHIYLHKIVTIPDRRYLKSTYYKQPEIFSYPQIFEKNVQKYQSVITRYFQEYNLSDDEKGGFAVFRIYLNPDKTVYFQGDMSSGDWDSFRRFHDKIDNNLIDRQSSGKYYSSPNYITFGFKVASGKIYFEKSYNPYIESLYNSEILKTEIKILSDTSLEPEFKLNDYLTKDFYLKLLSTVVLECFLLLLLSFFMPAIKNMKIIRLVGVCALASVITLPLLWFLCPLFISNWLLYLWTGEIMVAAIEAVIYKKLLKLNWRDAVIISVACNAFSCLIGLYANVWW